MKERRPPHDLQVWAFGEMKRMHEWPDDPRCQVSYHTLYYRLVRSDKWDAEKAITTPSRLQRAVEPPKPVELRQPLLPGAARAMRARGQRLTPQDILRDGCPCGLRARPNCLYVQEVGLCRTALDARPISEKIEGTT